MNRKMLVQSLKDSKAQVLFAFLFARCVLDVQEIQSWTGLKRETIYKAVDSLEGMGLLGHQVLAHGRKVYLPDGDMLPLFQESTLWTSGKLIDVVANSETPLPTITTTLTTIDQESTKRTSEEKAALNAVLSEYQIIGAKREQLIKCEWVNADYVRAHCKAAEAEQWDNPIGMAIYRMINQVAAPAMRENEHPASCKCAKCKTADFFGRKSMYTGDDNADFIEH